jgi:hypothetical protein
MSRHSEGSIRQNSGLVVIDDREMLERCRPRVRADCVDKKQDRLSGKTVCPFVSCKYNTYLYINAKDGKLKIPDIDVTDMKVSNCALDYDQGATCDETAAAMNLTRQRVSQATDNALMKMSKRMPKIEFTEPRQSNLAAAQDFAFGDGGT